MRHHARHDSELLSSPEGSGNIIEMTISKTQRLLRTHGISRLPFVYTGRATPLEQPQLSTEAGADIREKNFSSALLGHLDGLKSKVTKTD